MWCYGVSINICRYYECFSIMDNVRFEAVVRAFYNNFSAFYKIDNINYASGMVNYLLVNQCLLVSMKDKASNPVRSSRHPSPSETDSVRFSIFSFVHDVVRSHCITFYRVPKILDVVYHQVPCAPIP